MTTPASFDTNARYVRIVHAREDGWVEFEFAIGEPGLFVEMVMPRAQFDEFCAAQKVTPTTGSLEAAPAGSQEHEWDWNLHAAREQRFRQGN